MALSPEQLSGLERLLLTAEADASPLPQIRAGFPGMTVTRCDADDMRGESPYRRSGAYDLFLVDTSNQCWRIIDDPQVASGVVIAAHT
ncbi:MAG: HCV capsid domain containing protein [Oxalobacteraceae bacterium]|nr:HCV capsid domain containing protein [Oxalobacteraceae bacterium]